MGMDLQKSMMISASGMRAQSVRMRVISENLANANSTAQSPDEQPYRRKVVSFDQHMDREMGAEVVEVNNIDRDMSDFGREYRPEHPAADEDGYIQTPNVNSLVELTDMRQAQRTYEANMSSVESAKSMMMRTIDLLRS